MADSKPPPSEPSPSLAPGGKRPFSIFTIRPLARTERPAAPSTEGSKRASRRRWRVPAALLLLSVAASAGALLWSPRAAPPTLVVVNGAPQTKQTPHGAVERWWGKEITVAIDASVDQLGPGAREAAQLAFGTWLGAGAELPDLRFDVASGLKPSLEPDGVSSVIYAPIDIPGQKQSLAVTIAHVEVSSGRIVEVDIVINQYKPFALLGQGEEPPHSEGEHSTASCGGQYDLQNVMTHEVGHFFGLDEDEVDPEATMFFKTGKCELKKRDLGGADGVVMASLYSGPAELPEEEQGGCGGARVARPSASFGAGGVLALLAALGLGLRTRRGVRRAKTRRAGSPRAHSAAV